MKRVKKANPSQPHQNSGHAPVDASGVVHKDNTNDGGAEYLIDGGSDNIEMNQISEEKWKLEENVINYSFC